MARNKFLKTIVGLLNNSYNHHKSPINQGSGGYVHRQKGDGESDLNKYLTKYLTRYFTKYLKNFTNFTKIYQSLLPSALNQNRQNPSRRWRRLVQHKLSKSFLNLLQNINQLRRYLSVSAFYRLWRNFLIADRQRTQAGFVLPVTVLMILVMLLVVTSLMFRAFQRSEQVIGEYQLQQVRNAATPAIERAKAKIELLFSDKAGGVYSVGSDIPAESRMEELLAKDEYYTWSGEERLSLAVNGTVEGGKVAAWKFESGDTVTAYAILVRSARPEGGVLKTMDHRLAATDQTGTYQEVPERDRSKYFLVSNGPIITTGSTDAACKPRFSSEETTASNTFVQGWFAVGGSDAMLKKNIQVYAVSLPKSVIEGKGTNPVISTAQYQQDRNFQRANKWGAWFRTDIEINPAAAFNWFGAIHTEGSLYINGRGDFNGNLISKKESCFFHPKQNSDITIGGHLLRSLMTSTATNNGAVNFQLYPDASTFTVTATSDSSNYTGSPIDLSISPQAVLLRNQSVARGNTGNAEGQPGFWESQVDPNWASSDLATKRVSILRSGQAPPYIDDTYRADNRYGPKVGYSREVTTPQCNMGTPIGSGCDPQPGLDAVIRNEPPDPVLQPDDYGLDGYWERRARGQGTRIIVGQRLELGDAFGWVQDLDSVGGIASPGNLSSDKQYGEDPLNPPENAIKNTNMNSRRHELRQRRTQYDNLAAVQSTLVYHYTDSSKGYEPVAAVATTVHPGTAETLKNSATFDTITFKDKDGKDQTTVAVDFFNGYGTNGWEFAPPKVDSTSIAASAPLGKALRNLAYFAGDPDGAFPPKQEPNIVHPHPQLTMWGDFSNLRRIFDQNTSITLPAAGTAGNISLADLTTLQTASATLGMLAYNISYLQAYDYAQNQSSGLGGGIEKLGDALWKLQDGDKDGPNGEVIDLAANPSPGAEDYDLPPDAYIAALEREKSKLGIDDEVIRLARLVMNKEQVKRDRLHGFEITSKNHPNNPNNSSITSACDITPSTGNNYFGSGNPNTKEEEQRLKGLSRLCSPYPKFPSLYYIFPVQDHGHTSGPQPQTQPEPYIQDTYIANVNQGDDRYKALTDADLLEIAIQPKKADGKDWVLPYRTTGVTVTNSNAAPNDSQRELIRVDGANRQVAIKDSALFNGREEMNVRVLNLDIDMLRSNSPPNDNKETWLSKSGIIYAFREDAVREDAIARPAAPAGSAMNAFTPRDPALNSNGMSIKAIDYLADPDRRPYGFRLKNGADLRRRPGGTLDSSTLRGLTLISDNPLYIQGNFNLHTSNGSDTLTEFIGTGTTLDSRFANPEVDYWRPAEVLGDAVTILSNNFCDGSIQEGYFNTGTTSTAINDAQTQNKYGCLNNGPQRTSYANQNRPQIQLTPGTIGGKSYNWALANPWEQFSTSPKSPILVDRNGEPLMRESSSSSTRPTEATPYDQPYNTFGSRNSTTLSNYLRRAIDTTVNLSMIQGVVPARLNQGNGGLINFPRMLEDWLTGGDKTLTINGSFLQLNFSQYATGPFDADAWEPGNNPVSDERIFYYARPRRDWGYDVGLQYLPAGPVARRIVVPGNERSEFYREPKGDDPYICQLRGALGFACN